VILQSEFHGHGGDSAAIKVNALRVPKILTKSFPEILTTCR
jgi:hypothetical protein